jgi:predicted RNA-binding Zn ribbon-like protein
MTSQNYDFEAGALCLDFANTADWHASDQPQETLNDIPDLIAWGEAAGILAGHQARATARRANESPEAARAELARAIALREAIYRIFVANETRSGTGSGSGTGGEIAAADLERLNRVLSQAMARAAVRPAGGGFAWGWTDEAPGLEMVSWAVARSAAELLTSDHLDRVHQCADDRGCGYLFVDTSRNGSRRWCSMKSCGNRAKARRHYEKLSPGS